MMKNKPTKDDKNKKPRGRPPMSCSDINTKTFGRKKEDTIKRARDKKCDSRTQHLHRPCELSLITNRCVAKIAPNMKIYNNDAFKPLSSENSWRILNNPTFVSTKSSERTKTASSERTKTKSPIKIIPRKK